MAPSTSIERILSRRNLIRGHAAVAAFWSFAAAVPLFLLLLDLGLIGHLLVERGRLDIRLIPTDIPRFESLTGLKVIAASPAENVERPASPTPPATPVEPIPVFHDEHGILPSVWQTRDTWFGPAVAYLYRHVVWLQSNVLALSFLLGAGAVLLLIRYISLGQIRTRSLRGSIDAVTATRRNLHRQAFRLGPEDLDGTGQAATNQLFVDDVEVIRQGLHEWVARMIRFPLELLVICVVLFSLNWRLTLQWIAPLSLGVLFLDGVRRAALQKKRIAEARSREEEQLLLSGLKNTRLTRGLGIEKEEHERFQKHLELYHAKLFQLSRAEDVVVHFEFRVVVASVALLTFLLFLVFDNVLLFRNDLSTAGMTVADALVFLASIALAIPGIQALKSLSEIRRRVTVAADRIRGYLEQIPTVSQAVGAKFLQPMSKTLHFENVKYQTPSGRKILDGVDFKLEVDKTYALVSVDPLEANAIALMLPRFIEPREGRVMIDGEDIAWVTLESLRAETVFVAADDPPFEGTVFENIRGGNPDLTLQQVTEAAKLTHAHNFIVKLFNGYETTLSDQGDLLDAGQRFRLSLARAIVRDPALLIIEEPSASLDEDTKTLLVDAYDRICRDRTVIFLPTRMSTVRRTDQVVVLHEGKVAAFGPHAKLVTQSPVYRHWEYLKFNEFRQDL